uniref:Acetyltransferase component of pyruvate dehydrogenase complex n=1 Tax=Meloidogyne incognita TaxID=6306 RepID=A0A914LKW9_MELIC
MMNGSRALRILTACYSRNLRLRQRFSTHQVLHFRLAIVRPNTGFRYLHLTSKRLDYPDHSKITFPALSPTMEMGTIVSWQKKEGDQLSEGDLMCEIETDKATMGFEAPEEGYLAKIILPEGSKDVPVGKLLCIIVQDKNDVVAFKGFSADESVAAPAPPAIAPAAQESTKQAPAVQAPTQSPQETMVKGDRLKASPLAKKLAGEHGIDLSSLPGSGPGGRILAADLSQTSAQAPIPSGAPTAEYTDIPLSNMRKTIAKRLAEAKSTIPHYYLTSELYIDKLMDVRKKLNALLEKEAKKTGEKPQKLSINDFIIKASALSCLRVPEANSSFMGSFIRENLGVDVSVAVSTPSGLITPIIFDAHTKGVATIGYEVGLLAAKARDGKLQPHEFQGGTFTVSNLGMFGSVDHFTAIINPPQSCILAIGAARRKLVPADEESSEEKYRAVTSLQVTLSCDHRVVDGAVGAVWLQHFKRFMEEPITMILWGTAGMDKKRGD